jgi:hypothetical protein
VYAYLWSTRFRVITYPVPFVQSWYVYNILAPRQPTDGHVSKNWSIADVGAIGSGQLQAFLSNDESFFLLSEGSSHWIRKLDIVTDNVKAIAGRRYESGYSNGFGTDALFNYPTNILITRNDSMAYIYDRGNWDLGNGDIRLLDLVSLKVSTVVTGITVTLLSLVLSPDETYMFVSSQTLFRIFKISLSPGTFDVNNYLVFTWGSWNAAVNYWYATGSFLALTCIPAKKTDCVICAAGMFSSIGTICDVCPSGTFCIAGSSVPVLCPVGYFCMNSSTMDSCLSGILLYNTINHQSYTFIA